MYAVTVALTGISWRFMFRKKEDVEKFKNFRASNIAQDLIIEDDFGQRAELNVPAIQGIQIEDMEQSRLVHIESMVFQARVQKGAQDRVRREPAVSVPILSQVPAQ